MPTTTRRLSFGRYPKVLTRFRLYNTKAQAVQRVASFISQYHLSADIIYIVTFVIVKSRICQRANDFLLEIITLYIIFIIYTMPTTTRRLSFGRYPKVLTRFRLYNTKAQAVQRVASFISQYHLSADIIYIVTFPKNSCEQNHEYKDNKKVHDLQEFII